MMSMWAAVGDPNRRAVLELLRVRPHTVTELVDELGLSQPGVSKHLRVLKEAGLVSARPEGARRHYRLEPEPLRELEDWLGPFRAFWNTSLDALQDHLDAQAEAPDRVPTAPEHRTESNRRKGPG
ncbi:ArsR/SmtB family transcription factor [Occultella gossypii]|uniref:Winged helix-turn-helix transcriptional regulator n=1 Tax=Occultella gossypii TaxID=2800820 RepID=A0ABS7S8T6_9MICO|nr:metalloregulator ArsR/SmtB family transcription factor [Occultella gossypii]MBZ2196150.1 winged helix-turn-helix transcriptional regulator [Occultella gossypii]